MPTDTLARLTPQQKDEAIDRWLAVSTLGHALSEQKRYSTAEIKFWEAQRLAELIAGVEHKPVAAGPEPPSSTEPTIGKDFEEIKGDCQGSPVTTEDLERLGKTMNNLAAVFHMQGKFKMAEEMYERCLDLKLDIYGEEHLETAVIMHNLAALHCAKKRWEKAEILYKRALEIREKALGPNHADLVPILKNYAVMLRKVVREPEAIELEDRIAKIAPQQIQAVES